MTDGGHVPSEGRPEHLLPETGNDPAQGGGGWGGDLVGQTAPVGGPTYHFIDQPDDEEDVLLMPGPQSAWADPATTPVMPLGEALTQAAPGGFAAPAGYPGAEQVAPVPGEPVQQAAAGMPVEPSWPAVTPPGYAEAPGGAPVAPVVPVAPVADAAVAPAPVPPQPVPAAMQQRRPLHAGPPIPDPSVMTGQVPVRSLADRGPSTPGGAPVHEVPAAPQAVPPVAGGVDTTLVLPVQHVPAEQPAAAVVDESAAAWPVRPLTVRQLLPFRLPRRLPRPRRSPWLPRPRPSPNRSPPRPPCRSTPRSRLPLPSRRPRRSRPSSRRSGPGRCRGPAGG